MGDASIPWMLICMLLGVVLLVFVHAVSYRTKYAQIRKAIQLQNERLQAFADIYHTMYIINLVDNTLLECKAAEGIRPFVDRQPDAVHLMRKIIENITDKNHLERALRFADLETIDNRIGKEKTICEEFLGSNGEWYRGRIVVLDRDNLGKAASILWASVIVQEEKKREEGLIRISRMDEMTNLGNRRAYEEALNSYDEQKDKELAIVTMDINDLKTVNDTLGHHAGDELIQGAGECIIKVFEPYGKLFRTGGDEFVAMLEVDKETLEDVLGRFRQSIEQWSGEKVCKVSISYGAVSRSDYPDCSVSELAIRADEKMYEMKRNYYATSGTDRRKRR